MIPAVLIFNNHGMFSPPALVIPLSALISTEPLLETFTTPGKPRLSKFYTPVTSSEQSTLLAQIFQLVSDRPAGLCNFLDAPGLVFPGGKGQQGSTKGKGKVNALRRPSEYQPDEDGENEEDDELRVIYRHYATLYFV